jgi:hypothetical protein
MQNINLLYVLQPLIVIAICTALLIYWKRKRHFHLMVLIYSMVAYAAAIGLKYAVQIPTINLVIDSFGAHSVGLGLYYGLQTVFFEVGIAYIVAWYAVKHGAMERKDAEGYGSGLAFWENAVLLGLLPLINLIAYYSIISSNTELAHTIFNQLQTSQPALFASTSEALGAVALGVVERFSSILLHFAWGFLCVMSVVYRKKWLFLIALPMGFVDFLVPFASSSNLVVFEGVLLVLALLSVAVAWYATKRASATIPPTPAASAVSAPSYSAPQTTRYSVSDKKVCPRCKAENSVDSGIAGLAGHR